MFCCRWKHFLFNKVQLKIEKHCDKVENLCCFQKLREKVWFTWRSLAEQRTKQSFKWGIPLHWWLRVSSSLSHYCLFCPSSNVRLERLGLHFRTGLCFPQCEGIQSSPAKCVSSHPRGDSSRNTDLSCAETGQLLIVSSMARLYLENVIAGFLVRSKDTPSFANTVAWHLMMVSKDCTSYLLWKMAVLRPAWGNVSQ